MSRRLTTEEFIEKAKKVHGDRYDYSKVNYIGSQREVVIICSEHGEFKQTPASHLSGKGCKCCGIEKIKCSSRFTIEEFIEKAKKVHGDRYDYSKVNYINSRTKVTIICYEHGEFEQDPDSHLRGKGCPICGIDVVRISNSLTTKEFIEKAVKVYGDKYDYSKVNYINNRTKVIIICPEHGEFKQIPHNHLQNHCGCPKCKVENLPTTEEFIEKAKKVHGDKYDYSKVNYIDWKTKVIIICPEHGEFKQAVSSHLNGHGCYLCSTSIGENTINNFLKSNGFNFVTQKSFSGCRYKLPLRFDFYLPDYNMCIEYDGEYHYNKDCFWSKYDTFENHIKRDEIKNQYCKDNGIRLLRISFKDKDKIEEILKKELIL